jgi:cation diffusion facilitator CzcD-associated flavoprotein CzcO
MRSAPARPRTLGAMAERTAAAEPDHEVIVIGAGVCGIYQLYRLDELGVDTTLLEAGDDLGGTWFWNRYPGARFDSESISYGYSFSEELLQEWDWKERFSGQPENKRYLDYVADKFDLRRYMQFGVTVESAHWDDANTLWRLHLDDGRELTSRFLITAIGLLSAPTLPRYEGLDEFEGRSFHTYNWPEEPVEMAGKRVAVIGTGATGVQVIGEIADKVGELTVFQRRPNWCAPLHNAEIGPEEMADIKARYDEIFDLCARTPGGFIHEPDRRPFFDVPREERLAKWEQLYGEPGFGIWLANFRDIFMDEEANAEFSEFIADKIRSRVHDPVVAEKLIPKDHGFGVQRVPLETHYYEAYNRDNVHLVDLHETPIERITRKGIKTTEREYEFDIIVYATGFDAVTGAYDRIDIRGVGGQSLKEKWQDGPQTFLGLHVSGFPNMLMPTGPQAGSASTNFPRGIEIGVDWVTDLLQYMWKQGYTREEATPEAEQNWVGYVKKLYEIMLMRKAQGWFTGYNSNVEGHEKGTMRYLVFNGGTPKYRQKIAEVVDNGYAGLTLS